MKAKPCLSFAVVVFDTPPLVLSACLESVIAAWRNLMDAGVVKSARLTLVNNAKTTLQLSQLQSSNFDLQALFTDSRKDEWKQSAGIDGLSCRLVEGQGNIGYGAAQNLALTDSDADYLLVLNPDVILDKNSLLEGILYLQEHPEVVAASPFAREANGDGPGQRVSLCKAYPRLCQLALRGFGPGFVKRWFAAYLDRYEIDRNGDLDSLASVPIVSGCFILCRGYAFRSVGGFDERFFLYFEDFDLSLRLQDHGNLASLSDMKITHHGGNAARKGLRHILLFSRSAFRFFNLHGWRLI